MAEGLINFVRDLTLNYVKQKRHFELRYLNNTGTLQYGDMRGNFKPNFEILLCTPHHHIKPIIIS
jgi:hypothetical protein